LVKPSLNLKLLKEQVYEFLRNEIRYNRLKPGECINVDKTSEKLGISRTPLRDALLQMEIEGFVTIKPRRGIYVNTLSLHEIKNYYQVIGSLEHTAILNCSSAITEDHVNKMSELNAGMKKAIVEKNFDLFVSNNIPFHEVYLSLSDNESLIKIINNLKKRLYDFSEYEGWIGEWEESSAKEHDVLIDLMYKKDFVQAAQYLQAVHWSFELQEKYIRKYYNL